MRVRERLGKLKKVASSPKTSDAKAEVKALTTKIKLARSADELIRIVDENVEGPFLDSIHAGAIYHSLAMFQRRGSVPSCGDSPALSKLHARLLNFTAERKIGQREFANVLWSMAHLPGSIAGTTKLLPAFISAFPHVAQGMNAFDLSNCFYAAAQLKDVDVTPNVVKMVPTLAARIPGKVSDMIPQALSNCMWASARLKGLAPKDVQVIVPALCEQIPGNVEKMNLQDLSTNLWASAQLLDVAGGSVEKMVPSLVDEIEKKGTLMNPQQFSNCLWALMLLQDSFPELQPLLAAQTGSKDTFLKLAASRITGMLPKLSGSDLHLAVPTVVWACGRSQLNFQPLLSAVACRFPSTLAVLNDWGLCALGWSYRTLDPTGQHQDFQTAVGAELARRGLAEVDVERSKEGYLEWPGIK